MTRRMQLSFGLSIAVTLLVVCHIAAIDVHADTSEFDTLSDEQKGAAMALLKQAMNEIKIDPLELIRKGMEKVKEEQEKQMMGDEPQPQLNPALTTEQTSTAKFGDNGLEIAGTATVEVATGAPEVPSSTFTSVTEPIQTVEPETATPIASTPEPKNEQPESTGPAMEQTSTAKFEPNELETATVRTVAPEVSSSTFTSVTEPIQTVEPETAAPIASTPQPNSSGQPLLIHEQGPGFTSTFASVTSTTNGPTSTSHLTQSSSSDSTSSTVHASDMSQSDQQSKANYVSPSKVDPSNQETEETYIDESDPNDPKQVHVKNTTKSNVDDNGYSHEHQESITSASLGNNPNSYSHHSSSFSSSASGHVNGKPIKPINWGYNKVPYATIPPLPKLPSLPALPGMPSLPAMPSLPPLPMMPYGTWPGYYGQNYEDLSRYPGQAAAYAGAYTGLPDNFFGYANSPYMSRRQAKKLAKKQERAARRAREYDFES